MIEPEEIFHDSLNVLGFDRNRHEGRIESAPSVSRGRIFLLCVLLTAGLGFQAGYLQIARGQSLYTRSLEQSLVVSAIVPPRGRIFDVSGVQLAGNETSFDLVLYRSEFKKSGMPLADFWKNCADILGVTTFENGKEFPVAINDLPEETVLLRNVDQRVLIAAQAQSKKLPGVLPEERYSRTYQEGPAFASLLGYVGIAYDSQDAPEDASGKIAGKLGLERYYNQILQGMSGKKIFQIDAERNVRRIKTVEEVRAGSDLHISIDAGLQKKAYDVLEAYIRNSGKRAGAIVALDPRSGAVRALVSYPSFQNNLFSKRLSREDFESIFLNSDKPLFNRAVSGEYPPGSTIKPIIAAGALEENIIDPHKQIFSAGFIQIPNPFRRGEKSIFLDWKPLGWMDMRNALAFSSNVYFYTVGGGYEGQQGLGIDRIKKIENLFGLGYPLGIDFPNESDGFIPDPVWKARAKTEDPLWRVGDTYNVSIGQGDTLVTPLQVAAYTAVFANKGTLYRPYIMSSVADPETGKKIKQMNPTILRKGFVSDETLSVVREGMRMAVTAGTARLLQHVPVTVAGKTGTAQTGIKNREHAWFTGFAPYENPELVITVLVENGGEGSSISVPIARDILEWYFGGHILKSS